MVRTSSSTDGPPRPRGPHHRGRGSRAPQGAQHRVWAPRRRVMECGPRAWFWRGARARELSIHSNILLGVGANPPRGRERGPRGTLGMAVAQPFYSTENITKSQREGLDDDVAHAIRPQEMDEILGAGRGRGRARGLRTVGAPRSE